MKSLFARIRAWFAGGKITVIIPVLNEGKTIGNVVRLVAASKRVDEVIVVDNESGDDTRDRAGEAGAKVMTNPVRGKGGSMKLGLGAAKNRVVAFVDGDIDNYSVDVIGNLTDPILRGRCDFCKATFARDAGRVTELVAKPLLGLLFPGIASFSQPLSGMIAARKEQLEKLQFENDYGVDIGILIDLHLLGARIREVNIGKIDNKSKPWRELGAMAREVSRAILKRAGRSATSDIDGAGNISVIETVEESMASAVDAAIGGKPEAKAARLAVFTVPGVLYRERDIAGLVARNSGPAFSRSACDGDFAANAIGRAKPFEGADSGEVAADAAGLAVERDMVGFAKSLKTLGFSVGIVYDGFDVVATPAAKAIDADFVVCLRLLTENGVYTGETAIPSEFLARESRSCLHALCVSHAIEAVAGQRDADLADSLVVFSGEAGACLRSGAWKSVDLSSGKGLIDGIALRAARNGSLSAALKSARLAGARAARPSD